MKYLIIILLTSIVIAQEIPEQNPAHVTVKGRSVSHSWRDGRIFVPITELGPLLNIQSDYRSVDLIEALETKGGYLYRMVDGNFEAIRDRSQYSQSTDTRKARLHNRREGRKSAQAHQRKKQEEALQPKLVHEVQRFVAETGFVRAFIRVTNTGGSESPATTLVADFTDGYGKAFAQDTTVITSLQPGEHQDVEVFSMIRDEEMVANGVIRTVNNEKVRVTFRGL